MRGVEQKRPNRFADVAQLVEHSLGKGEVIGSIPIISSSLEVAVRQVSAKRALDRASGVRG